MTEREQLTMMLLRNHDLREERIAMEVERLGPRKPVTVGDILDALSTLPRDMPFKVDLNSGWKPLGTSDPYYGVQDVATIVGLGPRPYNFPIMGNTGVKWFVVE